MNELFNVELTPEELEELLHDLPHILCELNVDADGGIA